MPPENAAKIEPTNTRNGPAIRATAGQASILRKAYNLSNVASPDQLQALSESTGLPAKWIHQWFGRQRLKDRKKSKQAATVPDASIRSSTSSVDTFHVKQEIIDVSLPPPMHSPALMSNSSGGLASSESHSSVDKFLPAAASKAAKKKESAQPPDKTGTSRILRSTSKGEPAPTRLIALPTSATNQNTSSIVQADRKPSTRRHGETATSKQYPPPFPLIAPPRRSTLASESQGVVSSQHYHRSGLSANISDNFYQPRSDAPPAPVQPDEIASSSFIPRRRSKSYKSAAAYNQGPVFRTQFHNNGPSDYSPYAAGGREQRLAAAAPSVQHSEKLECLNSRDPALNDPLYSTSTTNFTAVYSPSGNYSSPSQFVSQYQNPGNVYVPRPLAPAFDWGNHDSPEPSTSTSFPSTSYHHNVYPPDQRIIDQSYHQPFYNQNDFSRELGSIDMYNRPQVNLNVRVQAQSVHFEDINTSMNPNITTTEQADSLSAIDPRFAPLRHLTDILSAYRDENGTYLRLLDERERPALTRCLLDKGLLERNPFQAAMGLALASRLGIQWEY
ncbi:hypothetical protein CPC08DRAFT_796205 [Agrocybe pediades]|nr:hypothetical protein CPC08DRAFT_796205 [Agrocybe pediades]